MDNSEHSNLTSSSSDSNMASSSQVSSSSRDDEDIDIFYFESDHLALKGNKDYHAMLRTICQLESQRMQATSELTTLLDCEKQAMADPIKFVEQLQNGVDMKLPGPIRVAGLPAVHWEKYTSSVDPMNIAFRKRMTRKRQGGDGTESILGGPHVSASDPSSSIGEDGVQIVRGRVKAEKKADTFNQLWTTEEQQRLEDLLVVHGPEPVEARRWAKVAESLGNRTAQQVASRVQKYFIRLAKAGLPIPGRMPNLNTYLKKGGTHRHQRYNRMYFQPSTFLQSHMPPVFMSEQDEDEDAGFMSYSRRAAGTAYHDEVSEEEDVPPEKRLTVEYQELMRLKRLRRKKMAEQRVSEHIGYKCDQCQCEPIVGTRWHCSDCPEEVSVDFCDECMDCQFDNGTHQPHHKLDPVHMACGEGSGGRGSSVGLRAERRHVDQDYLQGTTQQGHYNYLDPNYMPAS